MWDLIISVPDHCLSFYFITMIPEAFNPMCCMQMVFG